MSLLAQLYNKPAWVRYGAILDFDFVNQRYYGGYMGLDSQNSANTRMKSLISPGGNSTANSLYAPNSAGILQTFPSNAAVLTDLGLWIQNTSNTNQCGFNRNLLGSDASGSWVTTGSPTISTTSIPGANGLSSGASRITAGAANDTVMFSKVAGVSSASFTSGCYMKRRTGTGVINMTTDGGSSWSRVDNTSGFNSSTYIQVQISAQTLANPSVGFQIVTSGDAIDVDFVMCANNIESVTQLATPILTPTGAAVTRVGCAGFLNNPSVAMGFNDGARICNTFLLNAPQSGIVEVSGNGAAACLLFGMDQGILVTGGCDGGVVTLGSVNGSHGSDLSSTNTGKFGVGNINKIGWSYGGGKSIVAVNGVTTVGASTHFPNIVEAVSTITITSAGSGYTPGTYALTFSSAGGSGATGTYTVGVGGTVTSTNVTAGGSGYRFPPVVSFPLGGGSGAAGNANTIQNTHGGWGSHNNTATAAKNVNGPFTRVTLFPRDITEGELINYTS